MKRPIPTARFAILAGLLSLSVLSYAGGALRAVYLDGKPVTAFNGARYASVDVEIGKDGIVRITSRPDTLKQTGELLGGRIGADLHTTTPSGATKSSVPGVSPGSGRPRQETSPPTASAPPSVAPAGGRAEVSGEAPLPLEGRYWIGLRDVGNPAGFAVRVQLNGQTVGEFESGETRVVEVTHLLRRGENLARLEFRVAGGTTPAADRSEVVSKSALEVVLAPGKVFVDQDQIALAYPIFTSRREAATEPGPAEELRFVLPPPNLP